MTNEEFQTATDLQRVRLIKAELTALEASSNVGDESALVPNVTLQSMRGMAREWECRLQGAISIRKSRAKGIDNGE